MKSQMYRDQHVTILGHLAELEKAALSGQLKGCGMLIARLAGTVKVHLGMEDKSLYPQLMANPDPALAQMAKDYQTEMGTLASGFVKFVEKWRPDDVIVAGAVDFKKDVAGIVKALRQRIERENEKLYMAYDKSA